MAYVPQAHVTEFSYSVLDVVLMGRTSRLRSFAGVIYALGPDGRLTGPWDAALVWPRNLISFQLRGLKI